MASYSGTMRRRQPLLASLLTVREAGVHDAHDALHDLRARRTEAEQAHARIEAQAALLARARDEIDERDRSAIARGERSAGELLRREAWAAAEHERAAVLDAERVRRERDVARAKGDEERGRALLQERLAERAVATRHVERAHDEAEKQRERREEDERDEVVVARSAR